MRRTFTTGRFSTTRRRKVAARHAWPGVTTTIFKTFRSYSLAANQVHVALQIQNADHENLPGDFGWGIELPWGRSPSRAIDDCVLWFFDTYLKSETPVFPTNAEIYNVLRK